MRQVNRKMRGANSLILILDYIVGYSPYKLSVLNLLDLIPEALTSRIRIQQCGNIVLLMFGYSQIAHT